MRSVYDGECGSRAAPAQFVHIPEQRCVSPERGEILEQKRGVALAAQHGWRKLFDSAVPVQKLRRGDGSNPGNAGISVCRVADEGQKIGNQVGRHAELLANPFRVADLVASAVHLHDAVVADALRQVLVGCPDADFLDALVCGGDPRGGRERVVGLELDHRPNDDAHRGERFFQRMELRRAAPARCPLLSCSPDHMSLRNDSMT